MNRMENGSWKRVLAAFVILGSLCGLGSASADDGWKAGIAKANITPTEFMPMAGYAGRGDKHATGKLTDLWAKVLVIQDAQGKQAALVTLDLVGIDGALTTAICDELKKEFGWERSQIAFNTSHTHSGPVVQQVLMPIHYLAFGDADRQLVDQYYAALKKNILDSIRKAVADLQPATLSWGSGTCDVAVNRRNNKEPEVPQLRSEGKLKGPVDHDVPVLVVTQNGKPSAVLFGYACHNTVLGLMEWCGDYAGYAQIALEKKFPGCQAMFWAGCGADQNPLPRRTVELAEEYGGKLADAVTAVVNGTLKQVSPELTTEYATISVPFGGVPTREAVEQMTASPNKYEVLRAKYQLAQLDQGHELPRDYAYPVQVWKLGKEITFVFLSGEVVIDYALRLKSELGSGENHTNLWVAGYSNDVMAYIPSKRVLLEGGYEGGGAMVYYGLPGPWAPEVEELIVDTVKKLASSH